MPETRDKHSLVRDMQNIIQLTIIVNTLGQCVFVTHL